MDKPTYLGFAVVEFSKVLTSETNYDNLQSHFEEKSIQYHYIDTDASVLSLNTTNVIKDLQNLNVLFDFSNLNKNHELFKNKNKKVIGIFKIEIAKNVFKDEFLCLRTKAYSFKCGSDKKKKLKGISKSQSKINNFGEFQKCLFGGEYQRECDKKNINSINLDKDHQKVRENRLAAFDEKPCSLNEIQSLPWNWCV